MSTVQRNPHELIKIVSENICQMLKDRGVTLNPQEEIKFISDIQKQESESHLIKYQVKPDLLIMIFMRKMASADIDIPETPKHKLIVSVDKKNITSYLDRNRHKRSDRKDCEIFSFNNLLINITKHRYQPKYRWLTSEEKKELLKRYKTKAKNFPKICFDDPITKWYYKKIGDVVEIIRGNPVMGQELSYRVVTGNHSHTVFCARK